MTRSMAGGLWGFNVEGGGGSSLRTLCMTATMLPENGFSPVRNWYRITPVEYRSER